MKILRFSLFCESHYEETSWSRKLDGKNVTITIKDVEKLLNSGIEKISVTEIADMCVHKGKTDKGTLERSEKSNLEYPIIVSKDLKGNFNMILDGHHRLLKAINNKMDTINARILDLSKCPKEYQLMFN